MRIVAQSSLQAFWKRHPSTETALRLWLAVARQATWRTMSELQDRWPQAKVLNAERVRFQIAGGDYRMICAVQFRAGICWIKFIGTHSQYDRIDALNVDMY